MFKLVYKIMYNAFTEVILRLNSRKSADILWNDSVRNHNLDLLHHTFYHSGYAKFINKTLFMKHTIICGDVIFSKQHYNILIYR